jgi:hypothetical protein
VFAIAVVDQSLVRDGEGRGSRSISMRMTGSGEGILVSKDLVISWNPFPILGAASQTELGGISFQLLEPAPIDRIKTGS